MSAYTPSLFRLDAKNRQKASLIWPFALPRIRRHNHWQSGEKTALNSGFPYRYGDLPPLDVNFRAMKLHLLLILFPLMLYAASPSAAQENQPTEAVEEQNAKPVDLKPAQDFEDVPENYFPEYLKKAFKSFKGSLYQKALKQIQKQIEILKGKKPNRRSRLAAAHKIFLLKGMVHLKQKEWQAARRSLLKSLELSPSTAYTSYLLGMCDVAEGKSAEAIARFKEALWFSRADYLPEAKIYYLISQIYLENEEVENARPALIASLTRNVKYSPSRIQLAKIYLQDGNKAEALKQLRVAAAYDSENPVVKLELSRMLLRFNDNILDNKSIEEAREISKTLMNSRDPEAAYSMHPEDIRWEASKVYMHSLIELGEYEEAQKLLALSLKTNSGDPELYDIKDQIDVELSAKSYAEQIEAEKEEENHKENPDQNSPPQAGQDILSP